MANPNTPIETAEDEFDEILPEGWSGTDSENIFDPSTWGGNDTAADAQEDEAEQGDGYSAEDEDDQTPTTEDDDSSENGTDESYDDPTTDGYEEFDGTLKFQANIDHKVEQVELDVSELPTIYQKSVALDRYQARLSELEAEKAEWDALAKGLDYEDRAALREGLLEGAVQDYIADHPSVPEEMARDYIQRKFKIEPKAEKPQSTEGTRDFKAEVAELFRTYPEARTIKIPDEVTGDALGRNKPLVQAYAEWKARTESAKATRAERENKILKHNQAAAARAPVRKTTGGGKTDTSPVDDFLEGFNNDSAW